MHLSMLCPTTMNTGEVGDRWGFVTFARKQRDSQYNCDAKGRDACTTGAYNYYCRDMAVWPWNICLSFEVH